MESRNWFQDIETYRNTYVEWLKDLIQIPSVYDESTQSDSAPFGRAIEQALQYMIDLGEKQGFATKKLGGYAGHIEYGAGRDIVGVLGHLDVVPADGEWTYGAFQPTESEGKLYGRGTLDDKGPVMAAFIAMQLLKDIGFEPKKRIRLIMGTDEERDWQGISYYFEKEEMPSTGFTPDADFPVIYAEKGIVDGYITLPPLIQSDKNRVIEISGGKALNMVAGSATARLAAENPAEIIHAFESYKAEYQVEGQAEYKNNDITIQVKGRAAHGSTPEKGRNAIADLLHFLVTHVVKDSDNQLSWIERKLSSYHGKGLDLDWEDDITGKLTLNVGEIKIKEGEIGKIGVNVRYPVKRSFDEITEQLDAQLKPVGASFSLSSHLESLYVEKDDPLVATLTAVYKRQTGLQPEPLAIGGGTYARAMKKGVAFGPLFPGSPDGAHQQDEHIIIDDMLKAAAMYAEALYLLTK